MVFLAFHLQLDLEITNKLRLNLSIYFKKNLIVINEKKKENNIEKRFKIEKLKLLV